MRSESDQLFIDIFTTALEGGINYWAQCDAYHWMNADESEDYGGFYADIVDAEDDDDVVSVLRIDRKVIARGYRLATTTEKDKILWSTAQPPLVVTEDSREDWDFDAGDADVIVQLGLFGEVRYG